MENVMKGLFGSGGETGPADKDKARDFVNRYENGDPTEGYSHDEAVEYFGRVANHAPPETMQNAVRQSVNKLNPDQRKEFATMLQQRQRGQVDRPMTDNAPDDVDGIMGNLFGGGGGGGGIGDILGGLLGGGGSSGRQSRQGGGGLDDMLGGLLGGGGASRNEGAVSGQGGGGLGDILGSGVGKAVLAGAAAFAMKELMDKN
jgi:hypothetical protein